MIQFPSREFDDAVAAVCHGTLTEDQAKALGERLRHDPQARDEYLRRVALHARLASDPELFAGHDSDAVHPLDASGGVGTVASAPATPGRRVFKPAVGGPGAWAGRGTWTWALAAGVVVIFGLLAWFIRRGGEDPRGETSRAVAMLNRVANARWGHAERAPRLGAPLEPGTLVLDSGLAQIVFYNGARVVIEGPAELRLVSSTEAVCSRGTLTAEVPPQARGFRITAPRLEVTDLGTAFGLKVQGERAELHVFEGEVEVRTGPSGSLRSVSKGRGARVEGAGDPAWIAADPTGFAGLFDLQAKSGLTEARSFDRWRETSRRLREDPSLWVHFDFEHGGAPAWRLANAGSLGDTVPDAAIVGCEWREGRWASKPALEFRGVSDRVRLTVPGELESATLAAWVRVQGLDRQINSLFMSDGFLPGTLHWVIRHDGVLGMTVIGEKHGHQILASPPVLTLDQFGIWTHLAVVVDGRARQVAHYVNGRPVSRHTLRIAPPFRIGAAELGNWNAHGFPDNDPFMIRNFSGAMDEFCLFSRALAPGEIAALHADGRPQPDSVAALGPEVLKTDSTRLPISTPQPP